MIFMTPDPLFQSRKIIHLIKGALAAGSWEGSACLVKWFVLKCFLLTKLLPAPEAQPFIRVICPVVHPLGACQISGEIYSLAMRKRICIKINRSMGGAMDS